MLDQASAHIKDSVHLFTQNWQMVTKKTFPEPKDKPKELELVDQVFECGILLMQKRKENRAKIELIN